MNIAEIRTSIHHLMQRVALENFCPSENKSLINTILDALLKDELNHVAYTAKLIEQKSAKTPNNLQELFTQRMRNFNDITKDELSKRVFD